MNNKSQNVYWSTIEYNNWKFHLAATDSGLCCLMLPNQSFDALTHWVDQHIPRACMHQDQEALDSYQKQILEYLQGQRKAFTFPLDLRGTAFQTAVWQALTLIPYGETRSYSEIAMSVQRPKAVRAVGAANGSNPIPIVVPCHRVIGKNGNLTGYGGGLDMKTELLHLEASRL
jgi:methylated-DNA-[protein]-cysteine S-methyltransferase